MKKKMNIYELVICILIPQFFGVLSALLSGNIKNKYMNLNKPVLSPPGFIFGPVWTIIYTLIGISYYFFTKESNNKKIKYLYYLQMLLNFIWSILFFRLDNFLFSVIDILILDIVVTILIKNLLTVSKKSAYLLIPYLLWILFATYLNISIFLLN